MLSHPPPPALAHSAEASGAEGAIVSGGDELGAPRRTAVRVMHDACSWLLELRLPRAARRAFAVAGESERVAVKKAEVKTYIQ